MSQVYFLLFLWSFTVPRCVEAPAPVPATERRLYFPRAKGDNYRPLVSLTGSRP